jgi:hypothetical protein
MLWEDLVGVDIWLLIRFSYKFVLVEIGFHPKHCIRYFEYFLDSRVSCSASCELLALNFRTHYLHYFRRFVKPTQLYNCEWSYFVTFCHFLSFFSLVKTSMVFGIPLSGNPRSPLRSPSAPPAAAEDLICVADIISIKTGYPTTTPEIR